MGLFGKKAKSGTEVSEKEMREPKKSARSKKNELAKVLDESVWESVHEELKNNTQFITKDDKGNNCYVVFLFDTRQCGGLAGKDARKDESKGSIIEAIKTGAIKTYIRFEMLLDDVFIIIPDLNTIDAMDEFGILVDGEYILCTVSDNGADIATVTGKDGNEVIIKFEQIRNLIQNNLDVHTLFPGGNATDGILGMASNETADDGDLPDTYTPDDDILSDDDLDDIPDDIDDLPDDIPDDDYVPTPAAKPTAAPNPSVEKVTVNEEDAEDVNVESADDGGYDEFEDITEEVVNEYVIRKFYSDDLGLEVSTEPFDIQFMHGNSYVPFNENRGTGRLNEYISNFAKDANTRMQHMHNENLFRMREKYMQLIQKQCVNIAQALDVSDDSTQYGILRYAIEQNKHENLDAVGGSVSAKRDQLNQSWNKKLEQVAAEAAASAKAQYEDRYGRSHESDLQNLVSREKDEIERDYQASLRRMNDDRRAEASKLLDIAVNETLKELTDLYLKVLHDEQREQARLQMQITKFIDDNRKDEKARIETLAEERRQTKKAEEVRLEYATKIKAMSAEFDMKKTILQADVDRIRQEHDVEINKVNTEWTKKLNEEKSHSEEIQKKLDDLLDKYAEVDASKEQEYKKKLADLESEKETWKRHTDDIISDHEKSDKRGFKMSLVVVIAAVIAAIGIGFMCGSVMNIRKTSEIERSNITQSYQPEKQVTPIAGNAAANSSN